MRISNIQTYKPINIQAFQAQQRRPRATRPRTDYTSETYYEAYNGQFIKKDTTALKKKLAAIAAAAAIATSGVGGYVIGRNQNTDATYLEAYDKGWKDAYVQIENTQNQEDIFMPAQTVPEIVEPTVPPLQEKIAEPIPDKVYTLADGGVTEYNLDEKPFLYRENMNVPDYFSEYNIDANTLKTAQGNMARVFESGEYIIISPIETVTMGELKKVFGILDSVIGKEPLNELTSRPLVSGSNGNWDDAIVEPSDAIRIKKYDKENGHQVGVYTAHKSNSSRKKIAQEIIEWANK